MKRLWTILLAIVLATTIACGAASETEPQDNSAVKLAATSSAGGKAEFSDVTDDAGYAQAIAYCCKHGIMGGTSDTTFSPDSPMTRAMLAVVLYRMADSPEIGSAPGFTDTAADTWYSDAVVWASESGIISGYDNGVFGVNDAVTREQMATILWRYENSPSTIKKTVEFSDANTISEWAQEAVSWAGASGIIRGKSGNRFDPKTNVTRAEAAMMLYRWLDGDVSSKSRVLVAYFSATGTTRPLAKYAAEALNSDLYEIVPEIPYTDADLAYYTNGRADQEQEDSAARPAIAGGVEDMEQYDVVLLGYPIWHGQAPKIISTFLESYDFSGKTIVPFCTSHSSGIGSSDTNLHGLASDANWLSGRRFAGGTSRSMIEEWIGGLDLPKAEAGAENIRTFDFSTKTVTLNSGYEMPINGLGTYSLHGETCINSVKSALKSGVRLIDTASAYGNEEEVGQAIRESIEEGIIQRGEVFVITKIYPGSEMADPETSIQACLDRLNIGYVDMMLLHHPDGNDVKAYKTMERFVADGKIRSIGLSNWYVEELTEFLPRLDTVPALVQNEIHPYYQENDVIPFIQDLGIVVQGWYPLGGRGHTTELLRDPVISAIAEVHGVSSAQVILRWNLQKGVVVIPGSSNPDHIQENTELYHFSLTGEEMAQIKALDRGEKHDWY
ncbi:flavodoxin [Beduinella massiliensis]|uniref:flavodoxin n=1 Tax=Beduinella massiliensis TaxID=1852363 RepID=UPI000C81742F